MHHNISVAFLHVQSKPQLGSHGWDDHKEDSRILHQSLVTVKQLGLSQSSQRKGDSQRENICRLKAVTPLTKKPNKAIFFFFFLTSAVTKIMDIFPYSTLTVDLCWIVDFRSWFYPFLELYDIWKQRTSSCLEKTVESNGKQLCDLYFLYPLAFFYTFSHVGKGYLFLSCN